jgi:hypothetical protein
MKLKYLNKLNQEQLTEIGYELDFQFYADGSRKGSTISVTKDSVNFSSWDENYFSSKDYDYNSMTINDFEVFGLDYRFDWQKEKQFKFAAMMEEKFKDTNYKKDAEKYFIKKKEKQIEENKKQIEELERQNKELEMV